MATRSLQVSMSTGDLPQLPGYRNNKIAKARKANDEDLCKALKDGKALDFFKRTSPKASATRGLSKSCTVSTLRVEPSWIKFDKKVLTFVLYFKEAVNESPIENYRVRCCHLRYHLENNTISITEPKETNSGLVQGLFLVRSKINHEDTQLPYEPKDFLIGTEHTIFGRRFRVINCDKLAADYLREMCGIEVGDPETLPEDPFREKRRKKAEHSQKPVESLASMHRKDTLGKFLKYDRKVLQFNCVWDDTARLYGDKHEYVLQYFLSDDTLEIYSKSKINNPFPLLLKRQRVVRDISRPNDGYYTYLDLRCGELFDCFKRPLLITTCSNNTKNFYKREHGIIQKDVILAKPQPKVYEREIPPYNGHGSEIDSLANCLHLIPKANKADIKKYIKYMGKQLQFKAALEYPKAEDVGRLFVLTFYKEDDTASIHESKIRNSGIVGGKFLLRGKYKTEDGSRYLEASDFEVGKVIRFKFHQTKTCTPHFRILKPLRLDDADEPLELEQEQEQEQKHADERVDEEKYEEKMQD